MQQYSLQTFAYEEHKIPPLKPKTNGWAPYKQFANCSSCAVCKDRKLSHANGGLCQPAHTAIATWRHYLSAAARPPQEGNDSGALPPPSLPRAHCRAGAPASSRASSVTVSGQCPDQQAFLGSYIKFCLFSAGFWIPKAVNVRHCTMQHWKRTQC